MLKEFINESLDFRFVVVGAAAILFSVLFMSERVPPPSLVPEAAVQRRVAAAGGSAVVNEQNVGKESGGGVAFAYVPRTAGVNVVQGNGQYCLNAIRVAVPGEYGAVAHLPGTDAEAVQYLAEQNSDHKQLILDNGPSNVDTSELPPPGAYVNQSERVGVNTKSQ